MVLGVIIHVSLIVVLLHWKPHPDNPYVFYTVSGLWGVGDAVWQTQVNGTYNFAFGEYSGAMVLVTTIIDDPRSSLHFSALSSTIR